MTDPFALAEDLAAAGQEHLLVGIDDLDPAQRDAYLQRLATVDWAELAHPAEPVAIEQVGPSRVIDGQELAERGADLAARGAAAYRDGRVGVLMVAGGQGTRLGHSGPKGCYSVGAHSGKSIYQIQAEKILALQRRYGATIPFAVMTSPMTDEETRDFFAVHDHFGLQAEQVLFFSQGTVPSVDEEGRVLLAGPGRLLENPDGHGGCHTALVATGTLDQLVSRGVQQLVYIQVDNILAPADDQALVGLAIAEQADVVTKVFEKRDPDEKLGHLVRVGGRDRIIEYTELTPEQTRQTYEDGSLIYRWGSPAMHCWSIAFFQRLAERRFKLPLHRSKKPLQAWSPASGEHTVQGWKNERFIFDLLPEAERSVGLVADRNQDFAPVKNKEGVDSADSARRIASDCYKGWLATAGVQVTATAQELVEVSPLFAGCDGHFQEEWDGRRQTVDGPWYLER